MNKRKPIACKILPNPEGQTAAFPPNGPVQGVNSPRRCFDNFSIRLSLSAKSFGSLPCVTCSTYAGTDCASSASSLASARSLTGSIVAWAGGSGFSSCRGYLRISSFPAGSRCPGNCDWAVRGEDAQQAEKREGDISRRDLLLLRIVLPAWGAAHTCVSHKIPRSRFIHTLIPRLGRNRHHDRMSFTDRRNCSLTTLRNAPLCSS